MICPNCKTELVEVNGRYICSDCGREIPENEVMASDWGNGGGIRAGLYGAGTDEAPAAEEGSKPITDYDASLTEAESTPAEPATSEVPVVTTEPSVEEVLQNQVGSEPAPVTAVETPAEAVPDTGFYTAPQAEVAPEPPVETVPTPNVEDLVSEPEPAPVVPTPTPVTPEVSAPPAEEVPVAVATPEVAPEVIPATEAPVAEEVPVNVPAPETAPETIPEHSEVVKDMFEVAQTAIPRDPGIYTDPMYDNTGSQSPEAAAPAQNMPMPADRKTTLMVLAGGSVAVLLLIVGGIWGYMALNTKPVTPVPVVNEDVAWQELQVVDGNFKISFPGTPEKADTTQMITGVETTLTGYTYTTDDISYSAAFVVLEAAKASEIKADPATKLPALVTEIADAKSLTVSEKKVGKYYTADAIDFKLTSDTAAYQGKLIISGNNYILIMAGSSSGQSTEYDKFIKSFGFITKS